MITTTEAAQPARANASGLTLPLTVAAIFLSAALLFSVQPMFAKLVLPILGGSPSVWSVAMVFFQALLLFGYGYAHVLAKWVPSRIALPVHVAVLAVALLTLPMAIPAGWVKAPAGFEAPWLLALFAFVIGLPFFALSANGPLLQAWFARTDHPSARNPYFLYAASNIGSFAALLAYPVVIEPIFRLRDQTLGWTMGFGVLTALIALSGWQMLRSATGTVTADTQQRAVVGWRDRLAWTALALVPSGLLVSVTAHISTDVAAVPLLWVVPLALYLLTFVVAFSPRAKANLTPLFLLQVVGTAMALLSLVLQFDLWISVLLHLGTFSVSALVCHSALYARRPAAGALTEFYFFMSLGGCLGGVFAGLIAPQVFSTILEYPILLVAALLCRPGLWAARQGWVRTTLACAALVALAYILAATAMPPAVARVGLVALLGLVLVVSWKQPSQLTPVAVTLALSATILTFTEAPTVAYRSFFGVHRLIESPDGQFLTLMSGTTVHGAIRIRNPDGTRVTGRPEALTYYTADGPIGSAVAALRAAKGGTLDRVAVVGLGSGSLACDAAPGESWGFFEIDPRVVAIARGGSDFHFLRDCAPFAPLVLGDARLTLADHNEINDLIILDAFSSDSIPAHLITVEAFHMYVARLAEHGAIIVHVSNRNLELRHILARTAADVGLTAYALDDESSEPRERRYRLRSVAVVLARDKADLGTLATSGAWQRIEPDMTRRPWTDDFSNILEAILDKQRG